MEKLKITKKRGREPMPDSSIPVCDLDGMGLMMMKYYVTPMIQFVDINDVLCFSFDENYISGYMIMLEDGEAE